LVFFDVEGESEMQRTTINVDETLLEKIRAFGSQQGWSLSKTISELLKVILYTREKKTEKNLQWVTFKGKAAKGIDVDDRDSLYEMMGETEQHPHWFKLMISQTQCKGNHVFDAHIAALMREHGIDKIMTTDKDFYQFKGIEVINPL
jgi:predicted nucleic acid-binding protein